MQSEHRTRYDSPMEIAILSWDRSSILEFLRQKASRVLDEEGPACQLDDTPSELGPVHGWIGVSEVVNGRGERESIEQYLIRHTRLVPRDVVALGNMLDREVRYWAQSSDGAGGLSHADACRVIRECVARGSELFCRSEIEAVVNHVLSACVSREMVRGGYSDIVLQPSELDARSFSTVVITALGEIGEERFEFDALAELDTKIKNYLADCFPVELRSIPSCAEVLWQHRLLGVRRGETWKYFSARSGQDDDNSYHLPLGPEIDEYGLHPLVFDVVPLRNSDSGPAW